MAEFLNMGGYAWYVWSAYAATLVVLLLNIFLPLRRQKLIRREIARQVQQEDSNESQTP